MRNREAARPPFELICREQIAPSHLAITMLGYNRWKERPTARQPLTRCNGLSYLFLLNEGEAGRCFLQSTAVTNTSTIRDRTFRRHLSSTGTESVNMDNTSGGATFPFSTSLPAELRRSVWTFLCPELGARPLVLLLRPTATEEISLDSLLSGTTSTMRTVLAVHQDSRQLALEALDTLRLRNGEVLTGLGRRKTSYSFGVTAPTNLRRKGPLYAASPTPWSTSQRSLTFSTSKVSALSLSSGVEDIIRAVLQLSCNNSKAFDRLLDVEKVLLVNLHTPSIH